MEKVPLYKRMRKKAVTSDGHPQSASSEIVLKWADEVMQLEIKGKDKKTMIIPVKPKPISTRSRFCKVPKQHWTYVPLLVPR